MRKFNVVVNGNRYEVEIEEVKGESSLSHESTTSQTNHKPQAAPKPTPQVTSKPAQPVSTNQPKPEKKAPNSGSEIIEAPMPGTVLDVKVKVGDTVKSGDILLLLEAMKMENEIMAPRDGVVEEVLTSKGASVSTGDQLVVIK